MPELPSLRLARIILEADRHDDFILVIRYGPPGVGMSAHTLRACAKAVS